MVSGVCGRVRKTRFRPFRRSYVWRHLPTDVVIWKVVLPSGRTVNGTAVAEMRPIVCKRIVRLSRLSSSM